MVPWECIDIDIDIDIDKPLHISTLCRYVSDVCLTNLFVSRTMNMPSRISICVNQHRYQTAGAGTIEGAPGGFAAVTTKRGVGSRPTSSSFGYKYFKYSPRH